jgi:chromosome segregation ATPase
VEEVVAKVMQVNITTKLFQTMVNMSLNMGNLNLEVNSLRNILSTEEKEKAKLQKELEKKKDFQMEYKQNIKIWRKQKTKNEQKIKMLILKMKE